MQGNGPRHGSYTALPDGPQVGGSSASNDRRRRSVRRTASCSADEVRQVTIRADGRRHDRENARMPQRCTAASRTTRQPGSVLRRSHRKTGLQECFAASFREMLSQADIAQHGSVRRPRLHDLRGTFAVHRLLLWYEQDADLDAKLPLLSTYLGHVGLASSQRYLQLTKELVGEVTRRQQAHFGYLITDLEEDQT